MRILIVSLVALIALSACAQQGGESSAVASGLAPAPLNVEPRDVAPSGAGGYRWGCQCYGTCSDGAGSSSAWTSVEFACEPEGSGLVASADAESADAGQHSCSPGWTQDIVCYCAISDRACP